MPREQTNIQKILGTDFSNFNAMQSCNISMDRCFTSVTIANWALVKSFADVDTMKQYWKVIPKKLKSMNSVKTKFCYGCVLQQKISRCFLTLIRKNLRQCMMLQKRPMISFTQIIPFE